MNDGLFFHIKWTFWSMTSLAIGFVHWHHPFQDMTFQINTFESSKPQTQKVFNSISQQTVFCWQLLRSNWLYLQSTNISSVRVIKYSFIWWLGQKLNLWNSKRREQRRIDKKNGSQNNISKSQKAPLHQHFKWTSPAEGLWLEACTTRHPRNSSYKESHFLGKRGCYRAFIFHQLDNLDSHN